MDLGLGKAKGFNNEEGSHLKVWNAVGLQMVMVWEKSIKERSNYPRNGGSYTKRPSLCRGLELNLEFRDNSRIQIQICIKSSSLNKVNQKKACSVTFHENSYFTNKAHPHIHWSCIKHRVLSLLHFYLFEYVCTYIYIHECAYIHVFRHRRATWRGSSHLLPWVPRMELNWCQMPHQLRQVTRLQSLKIVAEDINTTHVLRQNIMRMSSRKSKHFMM